MTEIRSVWVTCEGCRHPYSVDYLATPVISFISPTQCPECKADNTAQLPTQADA